jgi:hypothetical protein
MLVSPQTGSRRPDPTRRIRPAVKDQVSRVLGQVRTGNFHRVAKAPFAPPPAAAAFEGRQRVARTVARSLDLYSLDLCRTTTHYPHPEKA